MRAPRVIGRLRRRAAWVLDRRVQMLIARMDVVGGQLIELQRGSEDARTSTAGIQAEVAALREELRAVSADVAALRDQLPPVLRAIVTEESANRRRLEHLRAGPDYAGPFEDPDPLVTVCIPTYERVQMLTERALPSVLAQTHRRLEVLVVGDASPAHVATAVEALGDERVRFVNLTQRHAATDAERHWMVGSVPARNAGYALAKGHWIVDFDDDDAMRPEAVERVLAKAREERLEVVYGKLAAHFADGTTEIIGRFPPTVHQFGWQCAVVHNGLRFLGRELVAASFGHPNDWFRVESMMRIGVRFGMVDDVLYDYYPARSWESRTPVPESAYIEEHAW
jgi:glycosyl transferase family 2